MEASSSSISIELSENGGTSSSAIKTPSVSVQSDAANRIVRLIVSMPRIVNAETSSTTAALLLDQLDHHQASAVVERVKINNLHFTKDGVAGLKVLLAMHATTVRHLQLNSIQDCDASGTAVESLYALDSLVHAFQSARGRLESLDLSRNTLGVNIARSLSGHTSLKKLTLDSMELSDDSLVELAASLNFAKSLEDLHVVLLHPLGPKGVEAASNLLSACTSLKALSWVYKRGTKAATLPLFGLCQLVQQNAQQNRPSLDSLVLEGARMKDGDLDLLCATLQELTQVHTLKLRNLGLADNALRAIVAILTGTRSPLSCLELSYNSIQSVGALSLIELTTCPEIAGNLQRLCVDNNKIDGMIISKLLKAFSSRACPELIDLRTDNNASNSDLVASEIALKNKLENDRSELMRQVERLQSELNETRYHLREITTAQETILADYKIVKEENNKLREERNILIRSFEIIGSANQVEAQSKLLTRISKLEDKVFGSPMSSLSNRSQTTSVGRRPPPRCSSNDSIDIATLERVLSPKRAPTRGLGMLDAAHNSVATLTTVSTTRSSLFSPNSSANSLDDKRKTSSSPSPEYSSPTRSSRPSILRSVPLTPSTRQQKLMKRVSSEYWVSTRGKEDMVKEIVTTPERIPASPLSVSPKRYGRQPQQRDLNQSCNSFDNGGNDECDLNESKQWSITTVDTHD